MDGQAEEAGAHFEEDGLTGPQRQWRDEDHASESVRMAREMFERLGPADAV